MATTLTSPEAFPTKGYPQSVRVVGLPIHNLQLDEVLACMDDWIARRDGCHWIYHANSHGIIESYKNAAFRTVLRSADLSLPDGKCTAWVASRRVRGAVSHIRAADLMTAFFQVANQRGYTNFFYGDTDEVLGAMSDNLTRQFSNLKIAGLYSPPFRNLSPEEDASIIQRINQARPDVLWVGLGLPKQEKWIFAHLDKLQVPVVVAVGASFKFLSGKVKPAPRKISDLGLEWLWRLVAEPKKCWHRALVYGPQFVLHSYLELKGFRKYD
jgi:N-acetylglucosaminyldiphosphoundecaprenol N-acetyl-beta-D-mannosaminyltransferase